MRLIDVDQVYCSDCDLKGKCETLIEQKILVCDVKSMPTIDAVPVVRCKDCKHWELGACLKIYSDGAASKYAWQFREAEDFCSYGKRRDAIDENT